MSMIPFVDINDSCNCLISTIQGIDINNANICYQ